MSLWPNIRNTVASTSTNLSQKLSTNPKNLTRVLKMKMRKRKNRLKLIRERGGGIRIHLLMLVIWW